MEKPAPIPPETLAHCAKALRVLAHPVRLRLADLLAARRLTVGELAEAADLPQAIASQHLAKMRRVGLVEAVRKGQNAYYRIANPSCTTVLGCIRRQMAAPRPRRARSGR